jgi:NAD(P)-dependent dehydrogenase (short-subunit alcohol dehydrogenase family)
MPLTNKVILITGASRGIGAELAVECGKAGAKVACAARASHIPAVSASHPRDLGRYSAVGLFPGTVEETAERIRGVGAEAIAIRADMASEPDVIRMIELTVEHFGRIDALVNNAALIKNGTGLFTDLASIDYEMSTNFRGPLIAMRTASRYMRAQGEGRILNVSSSVALNYLPGLMAYGYTKLALERLSLDVAEQLRPYQIACNVFRIDIPTQNSITTEVIPPQILEYYEPPITPTDGIMWMLGQPTSYTGQLESMYDLREREKIMPPRAKKAFEVNCLPFADNHNLRWKW